MTSALSAKALAGTHHSAKGRRTEDALDKLLGIYAKATAAYAAAVENLRYAKLEGSTLEILAAFNAADSAWRNCAQVRHAVQMYFPVNGSRGPRGL